MLKSARGPEHLADTGREAERVFGRAHEPEGGQQDGPACDSWGNEIRFE
jgi:hypothetical protein